jgi:hypothetical protein
VRLAWVITGAIVLIIVVIVRVIVGTISRIGRMTARIGKIRTAKTDRMRYGTARKTGRILSKMNWTITGTAVGVTVTEL